MTIFSNPVLLRIDSLLSYCDKIYIYLFLLTLLILLRNFACPKRRFSSNCLSKRLARRVLAIYKPLPAGMNGLKVFGIISRDMPLQGPMCYVMAEHNSMAGTALNKEMTVFYLFRDEGITEQKRLLIMQSSK